MSRDVTDVRIKYRVGAGGNSYGADEKDPDDRGVVSAEEEADGEDWFAGHDLSNSFRSEQSCCMQVGNSVSCLKDLELFKILFSFQAF